MNWPFETQKVQEGLITALTVTLIALNPSGVDGFICHEGPWPISLSIDSCDAAVIVRWVSGEADDAQELMPGQIVAGVTRFQILEILKDTDGTLEPSSQIEWPHFVDCDPEDTFLLYGVQTTELEWSRPLRVSEDAIGYIRDLPRPDVAAIERLRYLSGYLEHADPLIKQDAWLDFYDRNLDEIVAFASEMDREVVLARVLDPETDGMRLGTYGILLGYCGAHEDAELLEELILRPTDSLRLGIDGVMAAYLMLKGESGLELLDREKLSNPDAPFSEFYAAYQAVRFMWDHGRDRIPGERLTAAIRPVLDNPGLADLTVSDLGRWSDWSVIDRLHGMYDADEFREPRIKRAIVRYMLLAQHAGSTMEGDEGVELMQKASRYLADITERDPVIVENATRYFRLPVTDDATNSDAGPCEVLTP